MRQQAAARARADVIEAEVLGFIRAAGAALLRPAGGGEGRAGGIGAVRAREASDDAAFERLALAVFAYQFEANGAYRAYCQARGATPETLQRWRDIPAVPTSAFKEMPLCCFPPQEAAVVYRTSGTTRGPEKRGLHYLRGVELYDASLLPNFAAHVLPDVAAARRRVRMAVLFPRPAEMPQSSLGHMLARVLEEWGAEGSDHYVSPDGLRAADLIAALRRCEASGEPVALLGTAFSFVHLLDACRADGRRLRLPPGSRIMDTGGFKGRSREVPREELYRAYGEWLGVPDDHVVNEYGMTELGSQFYDNVLADRVRAGGEPAAHAPARRHKVVVPWVRTVVADPETLRELPPGEVGLLRHYDLANCHSAMAVQTDDLGRAVPGGFEILGRAPGAEARGCSIAADELLTAARAGGLGGGAAAPRPPASPG